MTTEPDLDVSPLAVAAVAAAIEAERHPVDPNETDNDAAFCAAIAAHETAYRLHRLLQRVNRREERRAISACVPRTE